MNNNTTNELVSIVVTSYNHAEYLEQRLQSLLDQTYSNFEIIVVDDNSTDNSRQVLEKYRNNPKIKLFYNEINYGHAKTCNLGVSKCRGEYVIFAECDDYCETKQIEILVDRMNRNSRAGVVYSSSNIVDENGVVKCNDFFYREKRFQVKCSKDAEILKDDMQRFLLASCVIPNMSAALIRKSCFESVGGLSDKYKTCSDWDFWFRVALITDFFYVSEPLNNFRRHSSSMDSIMGAKTQLLEIQELLHEAIARVRLTWIEAIVYRIKTSAVLVSFLIRIFKKEKMLSIVYVIKVMLKHKSMAIFLFIAGMIRIISVCINRMLYK